VDILRVSKYVKFCSVCVCVCVGGRGYTEGT
jgi:hypothetical protein